MRRQRLSTCPASDRKVRADRAGYSRPAANHTAKNHPASDHPQATTPQITAPQPVVPQAITPVIPAQSVPVVKQATATPAAAEFRRYVVPFADLRLEGEYDRRSWSIYLTPEQAAAPAKFNFAYQNAVVVAPEASQLTIFLNNRAIGQQQIGSPDNASAISFDVPRGLLQPGANLVTFEVTQRHRTDCNIQSTYELWSDIDPAKTYLSFAEQDAQSYRARMRSAQSASMTPAKLNLTSSYRPWRSRAPQNRCCGWLRAFRC